MRHDNSRRGAFFPSKSGEFFQARALLPKCLHYRIERQKTCLRQKFHARRLTFVEQIYREPKATKIYHERAALVDDFQPICLRRLFRAVIKHDLHNQQMCLLVDGGDDAFENRLRDQQRNDGNSLPAFQVNVSITARTDRQRGEGLPSRKINSAPKSCRYQSLSSSTLRTLSQNFTQVFQMTRLRRQANSFTRHAKIISDFVHGMNNRRPVFILGASNVPAESFSGASKFNS